MNISSSLPRRIAVIAAATLTMTIMIGCAAPELAGAERDLMIQRVDQTIRRFKEKDPTIDTWFEDSFGYAVFPRVTKGAAGIGGAHGQGLVFKQGELIGSSAVTQANIGFQLGGQSYSEIIFFRDEPTLIDFVGGDFEFSAQASAVALASGAAANAGYRKGVAIFTLARGGLMYEASIGGQKFSFRPIPSESAEAENESEPADESEA